MRPLAAATVMVIGLAGYLAEAPLVLAQQQLPPSTPPLFRPPPTPPGTGFYSRTYRAPGFSPIPSPPVYNSVSFYGRSYRAPGFSPVPSTPVYNAVSFYGRSYRAPGFIPQRMGQPVPVVVVGVPTIAIPEGFSAESDTGSYGGLNIFAPGSFPVGY